LKSESLSAAVSPRVISTIEPHAIPEETVVGASQTRFSYDGQSYGTAPSVGKLTQVSGWDNQASAWRNTSHAYNGSGNRTSTTDPNGNVTLFYYDTSPYVSPTRIVVDPQNGTGTQTTTFVYDSATELVTSQTDPNSQTTTISYTNHRLSAVDPYGRPGWIIGPDVTSVVGGTTYTNQNHKVKTTYYDQDRQVVVESDLNQEGDGKLKARTTSDELGRVIKTERNEDGTATYTISAQMAYKDMGKITFASQPNRSSGCGACSTSCPAACTEGWTRSTRDALGRVTEVAHFGQSGQPPDTGTNSNWSGSVATAYSANEVTVTDQAGKLRKSETDGLGRLVKVTEAPGVSGYGFETTYTYNALDNLTGVTQGAQTRTFAYDSLKRLTSATNPESGTVSYTYFNNGNLKDKTDARGITTEYTYDGLNRITTVDYSNTGLDPDIKRFYDGATNGKGRYHYDYANGDYSTGAEVEHTAIDSYDAMGRPLAKRQYFKTGGTWSSSFPSNLTYDLAGNVTSQTYPVGSSRKVNYEYDSAGRLSSFSGTLGGSSTRTYADQFSYWAGGQRKRERFGTTTNLYHNLHYNSRMQLVDIRLSSDSGDEWNWNRGALITYYSVTAAGNGNPFENNSDNNGNVIMATHYVPLNDAISSYYLGQRDYYTYDALNRIQDVDEWQQNSSGAWSNPLYQKFVYDRWGNRTIDTMASFGYANIAFTVDTANNRLGKPGGSTCTGTKSGMCYDAAGNLTFDDYSVSAGAGERTYDAENRMATAAGGAHIYTYDANGQRTRRKISGTETWQVYGFGGELLAEYAYNSSPSSPQKEYGYRSGQLLVTAESSSNVKWTVADHLGTPRIVVGLGGGLGDVTRHDYLPFGEESSTVGIRSYGTDTVRQKFTSYERDNETGLDYAKARYFSSTQGRFTSPDPLLSSGTVYSPQTWNRYCYSINNPLRFTDPLGLFTWDDSAGGGASNADLQARRNNRNLSRDERNQAKLFLERRERFRNAMTRAQQAANSNSISANERAEISGTLAAYGAEGTNNGVTVGGGTLADNAGGAQATPNFNYDTATNSWATNVSVIIDDRARGDNVALNVR